MRIAICDDDRAFRESFLAGLAGLAELAAEPEPRAAQFSGGEALLAHCRRGNGFDLVFLDIEMPGLSGLETGQALRGMDKNVMIVFLTGFRQYVFESFQIEAFDYLVKPPDPAALAQLMARARKKYGEQHYAVNVSWQDCAHALRVHEIIYIEGYHRHTVFYTEGGRYECVGKLDDYDATLSPYGFLRCHQGFLINMQYIKSVEKDQILTTAGMAVPMSVRRKKTCLTRFNQYLAGCKA